ncbi:MAG: YHS domain-containing (seleno)protein [Hyphomicrobiaceae bacterium]
MIGSCRSVSLGLAGLCCAVLLAIAPIQSAMAGKPAINTIGSPGFAIQGYDPVAYFEQGIPRRGKRQFTYVHEDVRWRFATIDNMTKFKANPKRYIPAYGGYCAYGVAQGYLVKIEPTAWSVRDDKLYLIYDRGVQQMWEKRPDSYIERANKKWPKLIANR